MIFERLWCGAYSRTPLPTEPQDCAVHPAGGESAPDAAVMDASEAAWS